MSDMTGKITLVIGGAGGLGKAICHKLADAGATLVVADVDESAAKSLVDTLPASDPAPSARTVDATDSAQVERLVDDIVADYGRIDVSVFTAGVAELAEAWEVTDEQWDRLLTLNLTAAFYCQRAVLRPMMEQRSGKIVNMSSICGRLGRPKVSAAYSAAKAGVVGLTMSAAQSVADYGININAIAPGPVRTELQDSFTSEKMAELQQGFPLGWGTPGAVADGVLYLASDAADWQTGTVLDLNGGALMG